LKKVTSQSDSREGGIRKKGKEKEGKKKRNAGAQRQNSFFGWCRVPRKVGGVMLRKG